jgi:transcriptional regulator with XRE-family HTH domain
MPNVDQTAKAWEMELAGRVGAAIKARRNALKLTAVELAERTKDLGYPVNRVAISKIEANLRSGKLDVAELLALAVALEIPPVLLLLPTYPDGSVDVLPRMTAATLKAREWLCGDAAIPVPNEGKGGWPVVTWMNTGVGFIRDVARRARLDGQIVYLREMELTEGASAGAVESKQRLIASSEDQLARVELAISEAKNALWGNPAEGVSDG